MANPRRLMRDEVFDRLLDAIVSGDLEPGEQLHDAEIEKWAGASRTPVREALNQLAGVGLVEILPQSRTRVSAIDIRAVLETVDTLGALVQGVARDAAPSLTEADIREVSALRRELEASLDPDQVVRSAEFSRRLSGVFVRRLGNETVARLIVRSVPTVRRALRASSRPVDRDSACAVLAELESACVSRDGASVSRAMGRYAEDVIVPLLSAAGDPNGEH